MNNPQVIIYTDFVDQVCQRAFDQKIKVVQEFHYVLGSFVKIEAPSKTIREFLFEILVFVESAKAIKKPVTRK